jgi:hypothetical protein
VRAEVRVEPEGAPDIIQDLSGAPPDCPVVQMLEAPMVRIQRPGDVAGAPDSVRCTREPNSELLTFGNSGSCSAIIHRTVRCSTGLSGVAPDCPVRQRSNGYFAPTVVCREQLMRYSAHRSQSRARRRTGQSTGPVWCTTGLSGDLDVRSSNGQNPTAG